MTILSKNDRFTLLLKNSIIAAMVMDQLVSRQNSQIFAKENSLWMRQHKLFFYLFPPEARFIFLFLDMNY